jgi:hypothetical protein
MYSIMCKNAVIDKIFSEYLSLKDWLDRSEYLESKLESVERWYFTLNKDKIEEQ